MSNLFLLLLGILVQSSSLYTCPIDPPIFLFESTRLTDEEARRFSYFKLGQPEAMETYEKLALSQIKKNHGKSIKKTPHEWVILVQTVEGVRTAASILAERVADTLHIEPILLETTRKQSARLHSYSSLKTKEEREANIAGSMTLLASVKNKKVLILDDTFVSGTILQEMQRCVQKAKAQSIHSFILYNLSGSQDMSCEAAFNMKGFDEGNTDAILKIVNNPKFIMTTKMIAYLAHLDKNEYVLFAKMAPVALLHLYVYALKIENVEVTGQLAAMLYRKIKLKLPAFREGAGTLLDPLLQKSGFHISLLDASTIIEIVRGVRSN